MAQKEKIESFIQGVFQQSKGRRLSKQDILSKAQAAGFSADVMIFFKQLPDQNYNENSLIDDMNHVIQQRGRQDAIGGLLRQAAETSR